MSSFNFNRNSNNTILKKKIPYATNPKINNNLFTLNRSNNNLDLSVLTLNGETVTADGAQLNYVDNVTPGTALANKAIIPDNDRNIANINSISCDSLIVNGNNIVLQETAVATESNSPFLQKLTPGNVQSNKALILDNNLNIETINKLGVNELQINNSKITDTSCQYKIKKNQITWTSNTTTYSNNLTNICWSDELGLGVIIASTGSGNRVLTSTNGINWVERTCPNMNWKSICWSPELSLFVAVANGGDGEMFMISSNGINWSQPSLRYPLMVTNGSNYSIILYNDGTVQAVGDNSKGQLGTGNFTSILIYTDIPITNVNKIATGDRHTLFLLNDGTIKACGRNDYGQLGNGNVVSEVSTLVDVLNINNAIDIQCGDVFSIALLSDNTVRTWGYNINGMCGIGTITSAVSTPVTPLNITLPVIAIACQYRSVFVLLDNGTLMGWGSNSGSRELGDGTNTSRTSPVPVLTNYNNITKITSGYQHNLALLSDGTVVAWGLNTSGQLGNNTITNPLEPIVVPNLSNVIDIACGYYFSVALLSNGTVMTWGVNTNGQLGIGSTSNTPIPTLVSNLSNVTKIFSRQSSTFVLLNNNTLKCWGFNSTRVLGNGNTTQQNSPIDVWSTKSNESSWNSVIWVSDLNLFIAVSNSGNVKIMTSSNGTNWNPIYGLTNNLNSIAWSKPLQLLSAVGSGTNPIITSTNGLTWVNRTVVSNNWTSVIWSDSHIMFIAVASSGSLNRIITSSNGTAWTTRTSPEDNEWISICNSEDLGLDVAISSTGNNRIMYSENGTEWYIVNNSNINKNINSIIWVKSLQRFIILSGNTIIYSDFIDQLSNIMTNNNWYSLFTRVNGAYTITQTGSDPDVQLQLNSASTTSSSTNLWFSNRIQDLNTFTVNFEVRLSGSADATSFNIGFNSTSFFADGPNAPGMCLAFRVFSGSGIGIYLFIGSTQVAFNSTNLANNTWNTFQIIYNKSNTNTWIINRNGSNLFTYSNPDNATWLSGTGNIFGFGSRNGGSAHDSFIRRFSIEYTESVPQSSTILNSEIFNTNTFNESITLSNQGKSVNAFSNVYNLNPTSLINFQYNFTPYANIWVSELNCYIIGGTSGRVALSNDGYQWTAYPSNTTNTIECITWSPQLKLLVAVCSSTTNNVMTSIDGINWTIQTNVPTTFGNTWNSVTWSSTLNLFVAVGNATHLTNRIMTSPDGVNWTIRTGFENNWQSICWSPELSLFVVVGNVNNRRMYSYDGINWYLHNSNTGSADSEAFRDVCWSPQLYLFVAISNNRVIISKDGINWNYRTINSNNWNSICWAPELSIFIAVATGNSASARIMFSYNGTDWRYTNTTVNSSGWDAIAWSSDLRNFTALNNNNVLIFNNNDYHNISLRNNNNISYINKYNYYKDNSIYNTWSNFNSNVNNQWSSICYSTELNLLVAVSTDGEYRVMTSSDGIVWEPQTVPLNNWTSVCWSSDLDLFVAVASSGTNNRVITSNDGINWISRTTPVDNNWSSICWSPELILFVAVSNSGTNNRVMTSPDGINWTSRTTPIDNNWTSVCWSPELTLFVAVANSGNNNRVMTSSNGINWIIRTTPVDNNWISVCWSYYYNTFIAISNTGNNNRIMKSLDGINWTLNNVNYKPNVITTTSFKSIYAGNSKSCAIMNNNTFRYWGNDSGFHFGSGTTNQSTPTLSNNIHSSNGFWKNIKAIATTNTATIVLLNNGTVQTRGRNQLGIDTPNNGNSHRGVINVPNLNDVIDVTAGNNFILALLSNGTVKSWGVNSNGQLGNNTTIDSMIPIDVLNVLNVSKIASHESALHSLALLSNGTVVSWGNNTNGQLGNGNTTQQLTPSIIDNLTNVIQIAVGGNHSLALLSNGTVMSWGLNSSGQLGNGNENQQNTPVQVLNINNAIAISAGNDFSLALLSDGTVMAWGNNTNGQLGDSTNINKSTPILISNLNNVNMISAGNSHSLALLNDGTIRSWGRNNNGQLGNITTVDSNIPVNVLLTTNIILRDIKIDTINDLSYVNNNWNSIVFSDESKSFVAISSSGTNRIMISNDGINWYNKPMQINNNWSCICWHNLEGRFIVLSSNNTNNVIRSNVIVQSILSTLTTTGTNQIGMSGSNLIIGGASQALPLSINVNSENKLLRLTNNGSSTNNVDFTTNGSTNIIDLNLNIVNNSNNKITNIANHTVNNGLVFNNVLMPLTSNDLNKLSTSFGTATASKALIADSTKNISNINEITVDKLVVNNNIVSNINDINSNYLADITSGISEPSKALVVDNNRDLNNLNNINSNNIEFNNKQQLKLTLNKSNFDLQTSYFNNVIVNNNYPSNILFKSICWSPELSMFVAVGIPWNQSNVDAKYHSINYSYDGIKWFSTNVYITSSTSYISSIAWSPTRSVFVAVYWNSLRSSYSYNGKDWNHLVLSGVATNFSSITWANDLFVAVANNGTTSNQIMTTSNGINWSIRTSSIANNWTSVTWGNGLYVAVSTNTGTNQIMTSPDGITWTTRTSPTSNQWQSVAWGNNIFVAVASSGTNNRVMTSTNGTSWTIRTSPSNDSWRSVIWASGLNLFIASNDSNNSNNRIMTSPDGINWTLQNTTNSNINFSCLCYSPELNLVVGGSDLNSVNIYNFNRMARSSDGTAWSLVDTSYDLAWSDLIYIEEFNKYYAISDTGSFGTISFLSKQLATSVNGIDWDFSYIDSNVNPRFRQFAWSSELNILIALLANPGNVFYRTIDGINWISTTVPSGTWAYIKWISEWNMFIAVASAGTNRAIYSNDGISWQTMNLPTNNNYSSIEYSSSLNLGIITLVSNPTRYFTSSNGIDWVERTMTDQNENTFSSTTYSKVVWISQLNMFIHSIPNANIYYYSYNGLNWISNNYIFTYGSVASAGYAITTAIPIWISKFNKLYVMATINDESSRILESSNGITWTQVYSLPAYHNNYTNLYWSEVKNQLIAYGINTYLTPYSPFLVLNNYIDPIVNYNISSIDSLNKYNESASNESVSSWLSRTSPNNNWTSICYSFDRNLYVAVANSGTNNRIMTSSDSITWTSRTSPADNNWTSVIYSKELGLFVAVANSGSNNRIMTSPDGITWTLRNNNIDNDWNSICWSSELNLLVAVSTNGIISATPVPNDMTSNSSAGKVATASSRLSQDFPSDASTWDPWNAFDGNTSGTGWHSRDGNASNAYNTSTGIYTGNVTTLDISENIYTGEWLQIQLSTPITLSSINMNARSGWETTRAPRNFVVLGSNDGTNWNLLETYVNQTWSSLTKSFSISNTSNSYSYFRFVIQRVGNLDSGMTTSGSVQIMNLQLLPLGSNNALNRILVSPNGINWESQNSPVANSWTSICWSKELCLFVAVANSGVGNRIITSSDAINWTARTNPVDNNWTSVCWSSELNLFVAVANSGTGDRIMTSSDAINWTAQTNPVDNDWTSVCWAPEINQFIAIANSGTNNRIMTSYNGIDWVIRNNNIDNDWSSICWSSGHNLAIAVSNTGTNNRVLSSTLSLVYPKSNYIRAPSDIFIDQSNGNVGIGLINPSFQLQLSTDSAAKPSTSVWSVSSDRRLKENIEDANLDICYNNIKNLRLVKYTWKDELYGENIPDVEDRTQLGWIADEVEEIFPKSISYVNLYDINNCKTLDSDQIIVSLYGTIQKLLIEFENQNNQITTLNNDITLLENYINQLDIE